MKYKPYIILILIVLLVPVIFGFYHNCYAQQQLLLNYPEIGGQTLTRETTLPNLIKYIYMFALAAVGVVALLSMLIGAVNYVLSAGNATKASDAKDQIFSAILGIILLLASVMILRTINPDLVNIGFTLPTISLTTSTNVDNRMCECTQNVRSIVIISEDATDNQNWCQQYASSNCPSDASSCIVTQVYQNTYSGDWMCDWNAIWAARFGPGPCSDCNSDSGVCLRYFNNTLHRPCSSAGTTCSATCVI